MAPQLVKHTRKLGGIETFSAKDVRYIHAIAQAAAGSAELWIIPGADHNSTYLMGGDEYGRRFRAFVSRVTASSPER